MIDTSFNFFEDLYHWLVEQHFGIFTVYATDLESASHPSDQDIVFCTTFKRSSSFGLYKFQNQEGFVIYGVSFASGTSPSLYRKAFDILLTKYTESVQKIDQPRQGNTGYVSNPLAVSV